MAPESPWWLIRKGRVEDAKKSLIRLTTFKKGESEKKEEEKGVDETIEMMIYTTRLEEKVSWALFSSRERVGLRLTLCGCGLKVGSGKSLLGLFQRNRFEKN